MLNRKKFAKEIMDIALEHSCVAVSMDGNPFYCKETPCNKCLLYRAASIGCDEAFKNWLNSEYKEMRIDWENVPADTPVLVRNNNKEIPQKRHFKRVNPNASFLNYETFPDGKTSWTNNRDTAEHWVCCELAREEDKQKYAKGVKY